MGSHSNKFNSLRYSFVRVLFKQLMIKIAVLAFALFAAVIAEPEAEASPDAYYGYAGYGHGYGYGLYGRYGYGGYGYGYPYRYGYGHYLGKRSLMLMPKPAQLCSMVPMDTHSITESTHTLMPHSDSVMAVTTDTEPTDTHMADTDIIINLFC